MTANIHRVLMTIGAIASGLGSVWSLSDVQPLCIPPEVGAVCALTAAITIVVANAVRANFPTE